MARRDGVVETETPVGRLLLAATEEGLTHILFLNCDGSLRREQRRPVGVESERAREILRDAVQQIEEYFAGHRTSFDLPLVPTGTPFQEYVWMGLRSIPYGETRSYGELAETIGNPSAVRAVGAANGANPLSIVVPCHRVIGHDRSLTGFGGGLDAKRQLLQLEGARFAGDKVREETQGDLFG